MSVVHEHVVRVLEPLLFARRQRQRPDELLAPIDGIHAPLEQLPLGLALRARQLARELAADHDLHGLLAVVAELQLTFDAYLAEVAPAEDDEVAVFTGLDLVLGVRRANGERLRDPHRRLLAGVHPARRALALELRARHD